MFKLLSVIVELLFWRVLLGSTFPSSRARPIFNFFSTCSCMFSIESLKLITATSFAQYKQVLSNEATRTRYDRALKFQEDTDMHRGVVWGDSSEFDDGIRTYRWAELRQKMQRKKYWEQYDDDDEEFSFYSEDEDTEGVQSDDQERGSFSEVLKSAFLSIFLMQTFGCWLSLTFSSCMALLDRKLDSGYKIGYIIAWILGGRGGILLTMCISFASWVCGKTSSSIVVLVVVAMWVGSNLARYAPLPQGALLTLLYMSIKLQTDLS